MQVAHDCVETANGDAIIAAVEREQWRGTSDITQELGLSQPRALEVLHDDHFHVYHYLRSACFLMIILWGCNFENGYVRSHSSINFHAYSPEDVHSPDGSKTGPKLTMGALARILWSLPPLSATDSLMDDLHSLLVRLSDMTFCTSFMLP
jgi:hypothetical protein